METFKDVMFALFGKDRNMKKTAAIKKDETFEPLTQVCFLRQQISMETNPISFCDQQNHEQAVRELAYHLWERAGRPEGDGSNFWHEAELQFKQQ